MFFFSLSLSLSLSLKNLRRDAKRSTEDSYEENESK